MSRQMREQRLIQKLEQEQQAFVVRLTRTPDALKHDGFQWCIQQGILDACHDGWLESMPSNELDWLCKKAEPLRYLYQKKLETVNEDNLRTEYSDCFDRIVH